MIKVKMLQVGNI